MAKFKVGDRVRVVRDGLSTRGAIGMLGYVRTASDGKEGYPIQVELDEGGTYSSSAAYADGYRWSWFALSALELVAPATSAVRTVTRREIVPGTYGVVTIYDDHSATVDCLDADIARAAAKLFNELADVLDENAAEAKEAA